MRFSRYVVLIMTSDAAGTQEAPLLSFTDILRISAPSSASKLLRTSTQRFPAQNGQLHASLSPGDGEIRTLDPLLARQVLSQLSYTPMRILPLSKSFTANILFYTGSHLLSHTVSSAVPSADQVLTIVFGMGTGVSPERIATSNSRYLPLSL